MDLSIHTYGHIDAIYYILNGIAMLMNHAFADKLMTTIALGSGAYYAIRIAYANTIAYKAHLAKMAAMVAMISLLLVPRTDMMIHDHVSKKKEIVSNLPLGFALPVGLLETFGYLLTGGFEQAFTALNNTNYRDYGMIFGARLVQESRNWRIRSPEFIENMNNFIDRCVMIEAMIGHHYTPEDLIKSNNIWHLVSTKSGTLRQVPMRIGKTRSLKNCKLAAELLEAAFTTEIAALETVYQVTDFGRAGNATYTDRKTPDINSNFKKNIGIAFKSLGSTLSADNLIRQQMMINSLKNFSDEYGYARSSATQESNWMIAGDLAATYLPILMSVLKGLVYSSFIFMLPLLIMSGGWGRYLSYLSLVASFQLWAPLNSVLNMFIDLYSSNTLQGIANNIVSFSTASRIGNYTDKIVAVASGLQMAIPFLAFSIIQGGVSGFIHLAGTITGASQSAASQAANESVTGNKSFDNYSVGNQQLYNMSGFKTDWNSSYAAGASSYQGMDGSIEKVTPGGNVLFQSGAGLTMSGGATTYRQEDHRQAQVTEGIQAVESIHSQDLRSFAKAKSDYLASASDYIAHLAEREHNHGSFAYEKMGEQGETFRQAVSYAKQLHDDRGYDWKQAGQISAEASASVGFKAFGVGTDVSTKAGISAENSSTQSTGESTMINKENNADQNYANLVKAMSNSTWAKENSIDKSYIDSVKKSYEEMQKAEKQVSISQQKVDDWHKAKNIIDTQGATSSRDMYQEVVDGIKREYGVDNQTANKMADRRSIEAQKVWKKIQSEDTYVQQLVSNISAGRTQVSGKEADEKLDKFDKDSNAKINPDTQTSVKEYAANQGMNVNNVKKDVEKAGQDLQGKYEKTTQENADKYGTAKQNNESEECVMQQQVDKHERGRISKDLGIGGPDKNVKTTVIDKDVYEKAGNISSKSK